MTERKQFRAIKGTRDILPPESALWNRVEETARRVFETYGYGEIRLPDFELARLFERSVGNETDIVTKELYSWIDSPRANQALRRVRAKAIAAAYRAIHEDPAVKEELLDQIEKGAFDTLAEANRICLRPEATASVVRAYIEHGMHTGPGDVKLYYIGPMFRRERPQKGRYRQFYQIGAEVLGQSDHPAIDAELLEMLLVFFERVGLTGCTLHLNSIGCSNCRPAYVAKLKAALEEVKDKLGLDSQRRIETNPLRVLDSKLPEEQPIIEKLPRIGEHLCADCRAHFAALEEQLGLRGIQYEINWRLVRGLDYYMRTTFEITAPGLGAQNAVCGGGRYDGLVELLGGPPTKGIGFAIGTDRVVLSLQEAGKGDSAAGLDVFIAWLGASAFPPAVKLARSLRDAGISVELPAEEMKLKKSLGLADRLGARFALLIGENEIAVGKYTLRRLSDGEQQQLGEAELLGHLQRKG
jgi:histidyl-tRNA synthetase